MRHRSLPWLVALLVMLCGSAVYFSGETELFLLMATTLFLMAVALCMALFSDFH